MAFVTRYLIKALENNGYDGYVGSLESGVLQARSGLSLMYAYKFQTKNDAQFALATVDNIDNCMLSIIEVSIPSETADEAPPFIPESQ